MKSKIEQVLAAIETPNQRASINQVNFTTAVAQARAEHAALVEFAAKVSEIEASNSFVNPMVEIRKALAVLVVKGGAK